METVAETTKIELPEMEEDTNESELSHEKSGDGELDPNDSCFEGFSPQPSPVKCSTLETIEKLEHELQLLKTKEGKVEYNNKENIEDNGNAMNNGSQHQPLHLENNLDLKGSPKQQPEENLQLLMLPFKKGWKRELYLIGDSGDGDVVYIHPWGLRLKSLEDLSLHLTDGLTLSNFTFSPKPLGAEPDLELITVLPDIKDPSPALETKPPVEESSNTKPILKESISSPAPVVRKSGRVPVPSSNYKIVERMEEESRKRVHHEPTSAQPPKREKLVLKLKPTKPTTPSGKSMWSASPTASTPKTSHRKPHSALPTPDLTPPIPDDQSKVPVPQKKRPPVPRKKPHHSDYLLSRRKDEVGWSPEKLHEERRLFCSIHCFPGKQMIPSLQCCACLCLYHPECVDVGRTGSTGPIHGYVCKSCRGKPEARKPAPAPEPRKTDTIAPPAPNLPPTPAVTPLSTVPQTIISLNRRRFVMVPNLSGAPSASVPGSALPPTAAPPVADLPVTEPIPALKPEGASSVNNKRSSYKKEPGSLGCNMTNFLGQMSLGYSALLKSFSFLSVQDLVRCSRTCRLWRDLAQHHSLWTSLVLTEIKVKNWESLSDTLNLRGTKQLDVRNITVDHPLDLVHLNRIPRLEVLQLPAVPEQVIWRLISGLTNLKVCTARMEHIIEERKVFDLSSSTLAELRLKATTPMALKFLSLESLGSSLNVLSLLSFTDWDSVDLNSLSQLTNLRDFQLGDCATLPTYFPSVLSRLTSLTSLRLENCPSSCPTVEILQALGNLQQLTQLELIQFDGQPGLDVALANLQNLKSLLLIPTFVTQAGTKITSVLKGIFQLSNTLTKFVWVFTNEFLQVTELYVDKYSSTQAKRPPAQGSKVPMLMPLPTPMDPSKQPALWQGIENRYGDAGTIAVVPMCDLQEMLEHGMPNTKVSIAKLPSHLTSQQTIHLLLP